MLQHERNVVICFFRAFFEETLTVLWADVLHHWALTIKTKELPMVFGVGATYDDGSRDQFSSFINHNIVCVGWDEATAPSFHAMLAGMSVGDVVFIKSFSPKAGLYIKAIGVIATSNVFDTPFGKARKVIWKYVAESKDGWFKFGRMYDKYDFMRGGTLYPEYNPDIVRKVLDYV